MGLQPLVGRDLVRAEDGTDLVIEDLGGCARQRLEPGVAQLREVVGQGDARAPSSFGDLEGREPVDVDLGGHGSDGPDHLQVVVAVEVRMDAALQADLGGPPRFGLHHPVADLVEPEEVRLAAQVEGPRSFREGAEAALEGADVGVVDVAIDDEGDLVAHGFGAQVVGNLGHLAHLSAAGGEQRHDLVLADLVAVEHGRQYLDDRSAAARSFTRSGIDGRARRGAEQLRGCTATPRRPVMVTGQSLGIGSVEHGEAHGLIQPTLGIEGELGVDGEARGENRATQFGGVPQRVEGRPATLGVHVVGGDRRHPAPIVDSGVEQHGQVVREVGRCLHVDVRRQHQTGGGDGPGQLGRWARRCPMHGRSGLGQEVLDDHLLDVPVTTVAVGDGLEGDQPIVARLTDAHEQPGGEGDAECARRFERGESPGRGLVRRVAMSREGGVERLEHHSLAGRDRSQAGELVGRQGAGIGVGEEPRLLHDRPAGVDQVVDGRGVAVLGEPATSSRVAILGSLAQGEEGLVAPGVTAGSGDAEDVLDGQVRRRQPCRRLGEGAVTAPVAAEHGERDEDLGREGHPVAERGTPHGPCRGEEFGLGHLDQLGDRWIEGGHGRDHRHRQAVDTRPGGHRVTLSGQVE